MLQLKHLTLYRSGKSICKDLYLEIGKGSSLLISGKNGSGKSSLISCLIGNLKPTAGQVLLDHHDLYRLSAREKKFFYGSTGIVLQQESLRPFDSISSLLSSPHSGLKQGHELLMEFGMFVDPETHIHELSSSERKKMEIIVSILKNPKLLVWDEPLSGLDSSSQENVKKHLLRLHSAGTTIIVASHDPHLYDFLNLEKILQL